MLSVVSIVVALVNKIQWFLYECVLLLGQWIIPEISGQCMPPNSDFVMEAINNTRAIIFGGSVEGKDSNTLYIMDILNHTVVSYIIIHTLTNNMLYNEC